MTIDRCSFLQTRGVEIPKFSLIHSNKRFSIREICGTRHIKTLSRVGRFFLVGVEVTPQLTPSSSNVTIFSRLLVVILQPAAPVSSNRGVAATDGVIAEEGLRTDVGSGGDTAMSVTAAARLNSLTLRGTKYSKCNELSCCRC